MISMKLVVQVLGNWAPGSVAAVGIHEPGWRCIVGLMLTGISEEAPKECMGRSMSPFWSLVSQSSSIFLWKGSPGWRSLADVMLIKPQQLGSLPEAPREQERASPASPPNLAVSFWLPPLSKLHRQQFVYQKRGWHSPITKSKRSRCRAERQ